MTIQKYPPDVKGHTISNLILVEGYSYDDKRKDWYEEIDTFGFTRSFNSRDIFLCINGPVTTVKEYPKVLISTIIHEATHNILTKHIGEKASIQLDNLFYKTALRKKLKRNLFGITELTFKEQKKQQKRLNNKKKFKGSKAFHLDVDFWLSGRTR